MSSFPLTNSIIFQDCFLTTNQIIINHNESSWISIIMIIIKHYEPLFNHDTPIIAIIMIIINHH